MTLNDLKRLFNSRAFFRLDTVLAPRLVPILYALGLAGLLLWAVRHLFASFAFGFGNGLWGLLEIAVFGLIWLVVLRIVCDGILVVFASAERRTGVPARVSGSLLDEVRDAIRDLAEDDEPDFEDGDSYVTGTEDKRPRGPATKSGETYS